jgi:hypothetical protein
MFNFIHARAVAMVEELQARNKELEEELKWSRAELESARARITELEQAKGLAP